MRKIERSDDAYDTQDMEEPVMCEGCGCWVELQTIRRCDVCRQLFCNLCVKASICFGCRPKEKRRVSMHP